MKIIKEKIVTENDTALNIGSGSLKVLSTIQILNLVENCCFLELEKEMKKGYTTVGISVNLTHIKSTPVGMKIITKINLIEKNDKKYKFSFEVYDEIDLISKGTHERSIISIDKFIKKTYDKLKK